MQVKPFAALLLLGAVVVACGGGGGDSTSPSGIAGGGSTNVGSGSTGGGSSSGGTTTPSTSDATLLNLVERFNISSASFPWTTSTPKYDGVIKRWSLPIPVKTNGEARANAAMDAVEAKLGIRVFDRTSIASTDEATITRGIVFKQGTAFVPAGGNPQAHCANVASGPNRGNWPLPTFMNPPGEISTKLYINLDNPQCTASAEIVNLEIGHALGIGDSTPGSGEGDSTSTDFWDVLATIYNNAAGTVKANVVIKRAN